MRELKALGALWGATGHPAEFLVLEWLVGSLHSGVSKPSDILSVLKCSAYNSPLFSWRIEVQHRFGAQSRLEVIFKVCTSVIEIHKLAG